MQLEGLVAVLFYFSAAILLAVEGETFEGDDCVCVDREFCSGAAARHEPSSSCSSSPGQVCCTTVPSPASASPDEGRFRRQTTVSNDAYLRQCGVASATNELPWVVHTYHWDSDVGSFSRICPGVLIHPQVVLTSANCTPEFEDDDEFLVYAGERSKAQARLVTKLGRHEYYNPTGEFDVALLYVDAPFLLGDDVRVLCLPQRNTPLDTARCVSTRTDQYGDLQKTRMSLQDYVSSCMETLPEETQQQYSFPDYSSLCAISRDTSSLCGENDEGGALACPLASDPRRLAVHGVVSLALGCSDASQPVVYTNTTYLATWIQIKLALVGLQNFAIPP